jgi:hypothetical protein
MSRLLRTPQKLKHLYICPHTCRTFWQAGGGFSFECSHHQGALLIMGGDAYREDASNQLEFLEYIIKHHRSWLDFAHSAARDVSLSDLILVDGCDKTSEWACAAWSEKSSSLRLNFVAGAPGIADGNACLWGQWDSSESLDKNVGPRPLIPPITGQDTTLPLTSQLSEAMAIGDPPHPHAPLSRSVPLPFNQCVFVRGFRISDRTTFFKRKRTRINLNVGSGFKTVDKPLNSKKWKRSNSTAMDSSQHLEGSHSSPSDMSRTHSEIIHSQRTPQPREYHKSDEEAEVNINKVRGFIYNDIATASFASLQHNTISEALMGYIFEVGQLANNETISFLDVQCSRNLLRLSWP